MKGLQYGFTCDYFLETAFLEGALGDLAAFAALTAVAFFGAAFLGEVDGLATLGLGVLTAAFFGIVAFLVAAAFLEVVAAGCLAARFPTLGFAVAGVAFLTTFLGDTVFLAATLGFFGDPVFFLVALGFFSAVGLTFLIAFFGLRASAATRKEPAAPTAPYFK